MNTFPCSRPLALLLLFAPLAACESSESDQGHECKLAAAVYDPQIVPKKFSTTIDNKYLFYEPGQMKRYVASDGNVVEEAVTTKTKMILGVKTLAVHDVVRGKDGKLLEDTLDYYAQDSAGNVWYFGEDTKAYSGSTVSTAGSWIAGQECARPGIVMEANPQVGDNYRQEYLAGEAEDEAAVVSVSEAVEIAFGSFNNCVKTREHTSLAAGDIEDKYYCPHVGLVRAHDVGSVDFGKHEELVWADGADMACTRNAAGYEPKIIPADFSLTIDNKYLPLVPGTVFRFMQSSGDLVEQDVLFDVKTIAGVPTRVVHDFVTSESGELLEDTFDYYAQDKDGNVWYFGEDTVAFSGPSSSTVGTWKAGSSCAQPGIVMEADPKIGDSYRQEYRPGEAEDEADVVSLDESVDVPYGKLSHCIKTKEHTDLAPGDIENKYYCAGVGMVRAQDVGTIDMGKTEDLVSVDGKQAP